MALDGVPHGLFICIEGIDAVGKRTQSSILGSWLTSEGFDSATVSYPDYNTEIGREIRRFLAGERTYVPEVRAMLYAANRWEKSAELRGLLSRKGAVIVNRYSPSNIAYGLSNGLGLEWLLSLEQGLPQPDIVLVLDAPVAKLSSRRTRNKDTYEKDASLQESARRSYLSLASKFGWKVLDATGGVDDTSGQVKAAVSAFIAKGRTV